MRQPGLDMSAEDVSDEPDAEVPFTRNREAFLRLVRHDIFAYLKRLAARDSESVGAAEIEAYFEGHDAIRLDPEARNRRWTFVDERESDWLVEQVLIDSEERNDWSVRFVVDLPASDEAGHVVMDVEGMGSRE